MSKHLVKIICICALAILLPLTIVGVALFVTEPVAVTLSIEESGNDGQYAVSNISIRVEGEEVEESTIKVQKHSEITVVFEGEGYDFKGWFNGKAEEINTGAEALSTEASYKFLIRENTNLTAIRDVIKYNVQYAGYLDDGVTTIEASNQIDELTQEVEYGATLESIQAINGSEFQGWYVVSSEGEATNATGVMFAKFDKTDVVLNPAWSNQMIITYKTSQEQIIAQERVTETTALTYALLGAESTEVKNALTAGKEFVGWVDIDGKAVTSITYDVNGITLYLKEQTITYSLSVKYNAVSDENATTITYDIDNGFTAYAYENSREYYTFKGFKLDGVLYSKSGNEYVSATSAKLADKLIADGNKNVNVVAVWECVFNTTVVTFEAIAEYEHPDFGEGYWAVYGTKDSVENVAVYEEQISVNFIDSNDAECFDVADNVYDLFIAQYSNFHFADGTSASYNGDVYITINGTDKGFSYALGSYPATFDYIWSVIESEYGVNNVQDSITISFIFEANA